MGDVRELGQSRHDPPPAATDRPQTVREEIANVVTHALGTALCVAALVVLVVLAGRRGDAWRVVSHSVYGVTLVLLYLASTLYHAIPRPKVKRFFRLLDHLSIYLLIAGTYTPIALGPMRGPWGWTLFGLIWAMALGGILSKIFPLRRVKGLSLAFYVAMGWLVVIATRPLLQSVPPGLVAWMIAGGLFYTLGIAFFLWDSLRYQHAIWHLFVLAGSACHFIGILVYVT